MRALLGMMV